MALIDGCLDALGDDLIRLIDRGCTAISPRLRWLDGLEAELYPGGRYGVDD